MNNDNLFDIDTSYDNIQVDEMLINGDSNVISPDEVPEVSPFDVIRKMADAIGQEIKDPNPSCNECYGRGYIGRDAGSKSPIPCRCIYHDFNSQSNTDMYEKHRKPSRADRRKMDRNLKKQMKKLKRGIA